MNQIRNLKDVQIRMGERLTTSPEALKNSWGQVVRPEYDSSFEKQIGFAVRRGASAFEIQSAQSEIEKALAEKPNEKTVKMEILKSVENGIAGRCLNTAETQMKLIWNVAKNYPTSVCLDFFNRRKKQDNSHFWPLPAELERFGEIWRDGLNEQLAVLKRHANKPDKHQASKVSQPMHEIKVGDAVRLRMERLKRERDENLKKRKEQ